MFVEHSVLDWQYSFVNFDNALQNLKTMFEIRCSGLFSQEKIFAQVETNKTG